jgi:hypothetical protein
MVEYSPGSNVEYTPGQMAAGATAVIGVVVAAMVAAAAPVVTGAAVAGAVTAAVTQRVRAARAPSPRPPDDTGNRRADTEPVAAE